MTRREELIAEVFRLLGGLKESELVLIRSLVEVLRGRVGNGLQSEIWQCLNHFSIPLLEVIEGGDFLVPADEVSFAARNYYKEIKAGGVFSFVSPLLTEVVLDKGKYVEASGSGYGLRPYRLTIGMSDDEIKDFFGKQPVEATPRGLWYYIKKLCDLGEFEVGVQYIFYVRNREMKQLVVNVQFDSSGKPCIFAGYAENRRRWSPGDTVFIPFSLSGLDDK